MWTVSKAVLNHLTVCDHCIFIICVYIFCEGQTQDTMGERSKKDRVSHLMPSGSNFSLLC